MTTTELARHWFETIWNRRQIAEAFNLLHTTIEGDRYNLGALAGCLVSGAQTQTVRCL